MIFLSCPKQSLFVCGPIKVQRSKALLSLIHAFVFSHTENINNRLPHKYYFVQVREKLHGTNDLQQEDNSLKSENGGWFSEGLCVFLLYQLFDALRYLHKNLILHLNISVCSIAISSLQLFGLRYCILLNIFFLDFLKFSIF